MCVLAGGFAFDDGERSEPGEGGDHGVDQSGWGRGSGGEPDNADPVEPCRVDVVGSVDEMGGSAVAAGELDQAH